MDKILNTQEVFDYLLKTINKKKPFSLIRVGDAEAVFLDRNERFYQNCNWIAEMQWGVSIKNKQADAVGFALDKAIKQADIIGIPDEKHEKKNSFWKYSSVYCAEKNNLKCSMNIHSDLLYDGLIDELINQSKVDFIGYISQNDLSEKFISRYEAVKDVRFIQIPGESKYYGNQDKKFHYPETFENVVETLKNSDLTGQLWLVGGGVLGKIYIGLIKQAGGMALDLGHVFDRWAGYRTRGTKGVRKNDDQFKL